MPTPTEKYTTTEDAARALKVCATTIRRAIAARGVPVLRFGKRMRFRMSDLEAALAVERSS